MVRVGASPGQGGVDPKSTVGDHLSQPERILAIDCSTRFLGWAVDVPGANLPQYGLLTLPGMSKLGRLFAAVRNSLCDLAAEFRPEVMAWCPAYARIDQSAGAALNNVIAIAQLVCHDENIRPMPTLETDARGDVLGRKTFGKRDAHGKIIKGTGTAMAKAAALAWCGKCGLENIASNDVADALVLLAHAKRQLAARASRPALPY